MLKTAVKRTKRPSQVTPLEDRAPPSSTSPEQICADTTVSRAFASEQRNTHMQTVRSHSRLCYLVFATTRCIKRFHQRAEGECSVHQFSHEAHNGPAVCLPLVCLSHLGCFVQRSHVPAQYSGGHTGLNLMVLLNLPSRHGLLTAGSLFDLTHDPGFNPSSGVAGVCWQPLPASKS